VFKQVNFPKIIDSLKKRPEELNRAFSKEKVQMAKNQAKKCSIFLAIKEMQIKTTFRFHLTPTRMTTSRTQTATNIGEEMGKKEPSYTAGGKYSTWLKNT
jgi:hypothetical protein